MSRPHIVAPSELSSLRDLELLARTTVEGLRQGLHRSPFHGFNAEFSQYRHYRPGDDLKYVDWKAFGRSDRLYSRQFRETTNLGALAVIDVSRSMAFPHGRTSKFELARAVAAVLIALVIDQGDAAGVLAVSGLETGNLYIPPKSGRHHLRVQLAALSRLNCEGAEPVATALRRAANLLRRRGLIIVITDFYDDASTLSEVRRLARFGHDVINFHIVAREELELPAGSAVEFVDLETNGRDHVRLRYIKNEESVEVPFNIYFDSSNPANNIAIGPGNYSFDEASIRLGTGNQRPLSGWVTYLQGDFFDGKRTNVNGNFSWKPSRHFILNLDYDWNDIVLPQGAFVTRLASLNTQVAFSTSLAWVTLIQYDNVSEELGVNTRLHWIPKAGQEGFIVLNHNLEDKDKNASFNSAVAEMSVKFTYTFRF